jgi:hypothetical protein
MIIRYNKLWRLRFYIDMYLGLITFIVHKFGLLDQLLDKIIFWIDLCNKLETLVRVLLQCTGKGMCHENLIVHVLRIYLYMFINAFSKLSLIFVYKENVH